MGKTLCLLLIDRKLKINNDNFVLVSVVSKRALKLDSRRFCVFCAIVNLQPDEMADHSDGSLATLKEMLFDENKLVTYISLSRDLCIHVNESKALLDRFVKEFRQKDSDTTLNVNYIISGLLEDSKGLTTVCKEIELTDLRKKYLSVFYHHLYSVSIGTLSADHASILAVNTFEDFPLCRGLIKNDTCVKRPDDEVGNLKAHSQEAIKKEEQLNIAAKRKVKEIKTVKSNGSLSAGTSIPEVKQEPVVKDEITSPKNNVLNNNIKVDQKDKKIGNKAQKGIAGFFNRNGSGTTNKPKNSHKVQEKENTMKPKDKEHVEVKIEKMDVDEDSKVLQNGKHEKPTPNKKSKNKLLNDIKKSATIDKKRKRVLHVSDSDSDDEQNDPFVQEPIHVEHQSDDEIPPTPAASTVKITSGIVNPRKRRKVVDKTFTDEDGYILTKKEEVFESCSENEEESNVKDVVKPTEKVIISPKEKKKNGPNPKKIQNSPQKGKQSSIMSFFKAKSE
jgi:DNA polymerase delta subunit 3